MPAKRYPMQEVQVALHNRNRSAERVRQLQMALVIAMDDLQFQENACWNSLPEGYTLHRDEEWSLEKLDQETCDNV